MLRHETVGDGPPLLLIHGAGEDAGRLAPAAEAFAAQGYRVRWYDRRGTGGSSRAGWPESGVDGHVDDAAVLLRSLGVPAGVIGFSSGGVIALALAAGHPDLVSSVVAWEPPVLSQLPDGLALHAQIMAPAEKYLARNPADWHGACRVLLEVMSADPSPETLANAEAMVRDDAPIITRHAFAPGELPADRCRIAIGSGANPLHAAIAAALSEHLERPPLVVEGADDHEIYLTRPGVLAAALTDVQRTHSQR
jgi:pimeloyl-ACP methyl ester carboxylesterase